MSNDLRTPLDGASQSVVPPDGPASQRARLDNRAHAMKSHRGGARTHRNRLKQEARARQKERSRSAPELGTVVPTTASQPPSPAQGGSTSRDSMEVSLDAAHSQQRRAAVVKQLQNPNWPSEDSLRQVASNPNANVVIPGPKDPNVRPIGGKAARDLVARITSRREGGRIERREPLSPEQVRAAMRNTSPIVLRDLLTPQQFKALGAMCDDAIDYATREMKRRMPGVMPQGAAAATQPNASSSSRGVSAAPAAQSRLSFGLRAQTPSAPRATSTAGGAALVGTAVAGGIAATQAGGLSTSSAGLAGVASAAHAASAVALAAAPATQAAYVSPLYNEAPTSVAATSSASAPGDSMLSAMEQNLDNDPLMHKTLADFLTQAHTYVGWTLFMSLMQQRMMLQLEEFFAAMQVSARFANKTSVEMLMLAVDQTATKVQSEQMREAFTVARGILEMQDSFSTGPLSTMLCESRMSTAAMIDTNTGMGAQYGRTGVLAGARAAQLRRVLGLETAKEPHARKSGRLTEQSDYRRWYAGPAEDAASTAAGLTDRRVQNIGEDGLRNNQVINSVYVPGIGSSLGAGPSSKPEDLAYVERSFLSKSEIAGLPPKARAQWEREILPEFELSHRKDVLAAAAMLHEEVSKLRSIASTLRSPAAQQGRSAQECSKMEARAQLADRNADELDVEAQRWQTKCELAAFLSLQNENRMGDFQRNFRMMGQIRDKLRDRGVENLTEEERIGLHTMNLRLNMMGTLMSKYAFTTVDRRDNRYNPGDQTHVERVSAAYARQASQDDLESIHRVLKTRGYRALSEQQRLALGAHEQLEMQRNQPQERTMLSALAAIRRSVLLVGSERGTLSPALEAEAQAFRSGTHRDTQLLQKAPPALLMQYIKDREEFYHQEGIALSGDARVVAENIAKRPDLFGSSAERPNPAGDYLKQEYQHLMAARYNLERKELKGVPHGSYALASALYNTNFAHSAPYREPGEGRRDSRELAHLMANDPAALAGGARGSAPGIHLQTLDEGYRFAHMDHMATGAIASHGGRTYRNDAFEGLNQWASALANLDFNRAADQQSANVDQQAQEAAGLASEVFSDYNGAITQAQNSTIPAISQIIQAGQLSGW